MSKNTNPVYPRDPVIGMAVVSAANANRDGTGTIVDVLTGGADGTTITLIRIKASVTVTDGMVRFYLYDGSTTKLEHEILVTATTPSATVASFSAEYSPTVAINLPNASWKLKASTEKAESINVFAFGANY